MRRPRIFIAEDEPLLAIALRDMLEELGCEVTMCVATVSTGIARLQHHPMPDGAVLDCNLRGEKAWPIAEILDSHGIPFVFSTGYSTRDIDPRFSDVPVLAKPFTTDELGKVLLPRLN